MWITATGGLILCVAIFSAVRVVYPRLRHSRKRGLIFWEAIAAFGTTANFKTAFREKTDDDLTEALQHQVFDVAKLVLVPKYRNVSLCLLALMLGSALAGTALLFKNNGALGTTTTPVRQLKTP
jgi:hypothetical protein